MGGGCEFEKKAVVVVGSGAVVSGEVDVAALDLDQGHDQGLGRILDPDQGLGEVVDKVKKIIIQDHVLVPVHAPVHGPDLDPQIGGTRIKMIDLDHNLGQDPNQDPDLGLDQNHDQEVKANKYC